MIDLDIAFQKLHQLQLEDGDIGASYWLEISHMLKGYDALLNELESAYAARRKLHQILELTAIALGTPLAALQGFDFAKVVVMAQKARIEALRFAECRYVASTMEEGEQAFVDEVDRHRRERSKTE
jgi:hypothetical protein